MPQKLRQLHLGCVATGILTSHRQDVTRLDLIYLLHLLPSFPPPGSTAGSHTLDPDPNYPQLVYHTHTKLWVVPVRSIRAPFALRKVASFTTVVVAQ